MSNDAMTSECPMSKLQRRLRLGHWNLDIHWALVIGHWSLSHIWP